MEFFWSNMPHFFRLAFASFRPLLALFRVLGVCACFFVVCVFFIFFF